MSNKYRKRNGAVRVSTGKQDLSAPVWAWGFWHTQQLWCGQDVITSSVALTLCTYCSQKCGTARFTAVNLEGFQENKQDRSQERRLLSAPDNKDLFCVLSTCTGFLLTFTHQTQTETRIKHDSPPKKDSHTGTIMITRLQSPALKTHNFWQHLHRLKQF